MLLGIPVSKRTELFHVKYFSLILMRKLIIQLTFSNWFFVCMSVFAACMYVPGAHGGQKRASDAPGWKLQLTMSSHWVLGIEPQVVVLCKNN